MRPRCVLGLKSTLCAPCAPRNSWRRTVGMDAAFSVVCRLLARTTSGRDGPPRPSRPTPHRRTRVEAPTHTQAPCRRDRCGHRRTGRRGSDLPDCERERDRADPRAESPLHHGGRKARPEPRHGPRRRRRGNVLRREEQAPRRERARRDRRRDRRGGKRQGPHRRELPRRAEERPDDPQDGRHHPRHRLGHRPDHQQGRRHRGPHRLQGRTGEIDEGRGRPRGQGRTQAHQGRVQALRRGRRRHHRRQRPLLPRLQRGQGRRAVLPDGRSLHRGHLHVVGRMAGSSARTRTPASRATTTAWSSTPRTSTTPARSTSTTVLPRRSPGPPRRPSV